MGAINTVHRRGTCVLPFTVSSKKTMPRLVDNRLIEYSLTRSMYQECVSLPRYLSISSFPAGSSVYPYLPHRRWRRFVCVLRSSPEKFAARIFRPAASLIFSLQVFINNLFQNSTDRPFCLLLFATLAIACSDFHRHHQSPTSS